MAQNGDSATKDGDIVVSALRVQARRRWWPRKGGKVVITGFASTDLAAKWVYAFAHNQAEVVRIDKAKAP